MGVFSLRPLSKTLLWKITMHNYLMMGAFLMHDLWEQCGIITYFRVIIRPFGGIMKAKMGN